MNTEKKTLSIMAKMSIALAGGIGFGVLSLLLREHLYASGNQQTWLMINNILFQDITSASGLRSIGIFYIIGQLFLRGLQLAIVPLVLVSLSLAICSMANPQRLGKIAGKTLACFLTFYVICASLAGCFAYFVKSLDLFSINLPAADIASVAKIDAYNPLITVINAVPNNLFSVLSLNNSILAVVVVALIIGLCMNHLEKLAAPLKHLLEICNKIIQIYMDFLINKFSPIAIFCMISRTFATYGIEYLTSSLAYILAVIFISLTLVLTVYPIGIFVTTGLNPFVFIKKMVKVALFAAATNSSATTLPLNKKTCVDELGCSEEVSSFILPTGMTINMNGTTAMHMMAVTFIGTSAGIDVTPSHLVVAALISIVTSMGTPAIPVAGTTMVFAILSGLGFTSELCIAGYALVLAMNYPPGMAVITLNVVGDAATNVIVSYKEGELDTMIYNS